LTKTKRIKGLSNPVRCVWLVLPILMEDIEINIIPLFDEKRDEEDEENEKM